jgi:tRNA/tmRNA/rRNA uracil-C5-methylase (TrmA/RlmC/RlmD family)
LVDPPRQGLDPIVCDMVLQEQQLFTHLLYFSCGHDALLRDLDRLFSSPLQDVRSTNHDHNQYTNNNSNYYAVVNCLQLDLFPGTYSIETFGTFTKNRNIY